MSQTGYSVGDNKRLYFDRTRVRILLCDDDPVAGKEVSDLLQKCYYQVATVRSARQAIELLKVSGLEIDLILVEVELPNKNAFKMLKHVTKEDHMNHIPIVMMSARNEMAVVVKCLRLGAADYLVKPLRINELLNLWTHMWRRRKLLGIPERNLISVSDTSVSNTISTDVHSENDTNENLNVAARKTGQFEKSNTLEIPHILRTGVEVASLSPGHKDCEPFLPRRVELKAGGLSAFFSYTRLTNQSHENVRDHVPTAMRTKTGCVNQEPIKGTFSGVDLQHIESKTRSDVLLMENEDDRGKCLEGGEDFSWVPHKKLKPNEGVVGLSMLNNNSAECSAAPAEIDRLDITCGGSREISNNSKQNMIFSQGPLLMPIGAESAHVAGVPILPAFPFPTLMLPGFVPPLMTGSALVSPALPPISGVPDVRIKTTPSYPSFQPLPTFQELPQPYYIPLPAQFSPYPICPNLTSSLIPQGTAGLAERRKIALSKFRKKRKEK